MKIKDYLKLITDRDFSQTLEYLVEKTAKNSGKTFIVSINPEIIMLARKDGEFESILRSADLALNDGAGVSLALSLFNMPPRARITGVDLVEKLSEAIAEKPATIGYLGGKGNVAERTSERLRKKYPSLKVAFALEEPIELKKMEADVLFVAFGSPKQEKWIAENLDRLPVKVVMGVGGAFDFISGEVMRAPKLIRSLGLEWLFRLVMQPWRLKRQTKLVGFIFLVFKEIFASF